MAWRDGNDVGRIYRLTQQALEVGRASWHRLKEGDLLLCVKHTGDAHYMYVLLEPRVDNGHDVYLTVIRTVSSYALGEVAFPEVAILDDRRMLDAMLQGELLLPSDKVHAGWQLEEGMEVYQLRSPTMVQLWKHQNREDLWQPYLPNGAPFGPPGTEEYIRTSFQPRL